MILVITAPSDVHAEPVIRHLVRRGLAVRRFDPADCPTRANLTFRASSSTVTLRFDEEGALSFDLRDVRVAWFRRPGRPRIAGSLEAAVRADTVSQSQAFIDDVWPLMPTAWLPAVPSQLSRYGKLAQLAIARTVGFDIPPTIVTNDPAEFLSFYREHDGNIVSKLLGRSAVNSADSPFARFTEAVRPRDLVEADAIRFCPVIFQANLPKREELRVTVVGDQVYVAAIQSQRTPRTMLDWRRYDQRSTPVTPCDLPAQVSEQCRALVARLGLSFATLDLIVLPNGGIVFVELNPNGQYLWIEQATGLPISEGVAAWLEDHAA